MASLLYRSPIEELLNSYTTIEQSAISAPSLHAFKAVETANHDCFNFALNARAKEKLISSGIYLSPFSFIPHSHPVCKTLENYLLYKVLPSYVDNSFYFVGIKNNKLEFLKKRNPSLSMIELINRFVTSKDKLRYGSEFNTLRSKSLVATADTGRKFKSGTLKDLLPIAIQRKASKVFLHDELHYWDKDDLITFLEELKPELVLGTVVFPPEILAGSTVSLNQWCYDFEVSGNNLHFFPDGVHTECYTQPITGGYLLKTKRIITSDGSIYCVDLLHSKFAHHLIAITRGDSKTERERFFGNFEAISTKALEGVSCHAGASYPIACQTVTKIYNYLETLLKPDGQSATAKLCQLIQNPTGAEIKFVKEFSRFVIGTRGVSTMILPDYKKKVGAFFASLLPAYAAVHFKCYKEVVLHEFIACIKQYSFRVELQDVRRGGCIEFAERLEGAVAQYIGDWSCSLPDPFSSGMEDSLSSDRLGQPYSMGGSLLHTPMEALDVKCADLIKLCCSVAFSTCNVYSKEVEMDDLKDLLLSQFYSSAVGRMLVHRLDKGTLLTVKKGVHLRLLRVHKLLFATNALQWFLIKSRYNTKYIGQKPCGISSESASIYKVCISEIVSGGFEGKLLKRETEYDTILYPKFNNKHCAQTPRPRTITISMPDQGKTENIVMHEASTVVEDKSDFKMKVVGEQNELCSCHTKLPIGEFLGFDIVSANFPDRLRNRSCGWYSRDGSGYDYNGGSHKSMGWPEWLDILLDVNGFNQYAFDGMLAQRYDENAKIGFHSDDEEQLDGDAPVLTVNVSGSGLFKIAGKQCGASVVMIAGKYLMMPRGFQRSHKHSISECTGGRISLTFRVMSKKFIPKEVRGVSLEARAEELDGALEYFVGGVSVQIQQGADVENYKRVEVLGDGNCFWHSVGYFLGIAGVTLKDYCRKLGKAEISESIALREQMEGSNFAEEEAIALFCSMQLVSVKVLIPAEGCTRVFSPKEAEFQFTILCSAEHFEPLLPRNDCIIESIAAALCRNPNDVMKVISRPQYSHILKELEEGCGLSVFLLEETFRIFGIRAITCFPDETVVLNEEGSIEKVFEISEDHIKNIERAVIPSMHYLKRNDVESFPKGALQILRKAGTTFDFVASYSRAHCLSSSLHSGTTGAICSKLFHSAENLLGEAECSTPERTITAVLGTFGAGKSHLFKEFIAKSPGKHVTFVSPRRVLAEAVKKDIFGQDACNNPRDKRKSGGKGQHWQVFTFEVFLKIAKNLKPGQVVIVDEIQLYPPGYLDLICFLMPKEVATFIVGDPCQSDYDSEKDRAIFSGMVNDICRVLDGKSYKYVIESKRFINEIFLNRLPCSLDKSRLSIHEEYRMVDGLDGVEELPESFKKVFLVSSFIEKRLVRARFPGGGVKCLTFGESTGMTFKRGCIMVTPDSENVSEKRWLTALSRFSENLALVNLLGVSFEELFSAFSGRALFKFMSGTASVEDMVDILPGEPDFLKTFNAKVGKDAGIRELKLSGDPWLKTMIDLAQEEDIEKTEIQEWLESPEVFKTHLPRCELESLRAGWVHKILAKEDREMRIKGLVTNQFTDQHSKNNGKILTNAAERFETIYPRHRNNDTATFLMAVKKRLRFSKPSVENAKLREAGLFGESMLKLFLSKIPLKSAHNSKFMAKALKDFGDKKTSKSTATIANHAQRSCRDWLADVGLIFMKSQLCTKFDNRFRNAKAAQSIVCFQHAVLCRFAPYMRYIEMKLNEVLPKNFYIHSGKGLEDLNKWVKSGGFTGVCTESDYEAFDASQDQYIMSFELEVMKYLGLPRDLIEDYKYIKTHLGSKLGNFAIMRFSGEASTFLFNTMANMLFTFMRYDLNGNESICFAGDDMCASKRLRLSSDYEDFLARLKLKAKVDFTKTPTFCGWNLSADGIFKKPQLVLERLCIAMETNNLVNCIDNYALEVAYAYKMGERALNRMSEEEVGCHYNCVRIIVRNMHLIKSDVYDVFKNAVGEVRDR